MNWIDYSDLPTDNTAFSSLFVDYIMDYPRVRRYYNGNFQEDKDWEKALEQVTAREIDRSLLSQILTTQNRDFHCGVKALANIDLLMNDNTVAVVTGQQVGLFTGPLYTIYKALTVLKLVNLLSKKFPDYNFVPVFWLEGEDHDYEEVNSIKLINPSNDLVQLEYQLQTKALEKNLGPVGFLEFDETIDGFFKKVDECLIQTEFKQKALELFHTAYQKGMTFNRAFVHLMNVLLEDSGLIFLDPHSPDIKKQLVHVFRRDIEETPRLCQLIIDQSAELEKHYHAQIKPKPLNLFLLADGGRYLLEPNSNGYSLKGSRRQIPKERIQEILANSPELLSPNVVLRPICQDTLLPTIAYVAGPAEIAYFAQLKPLYQEFSIPQPIIYPRASVTILEEKIENILTRYSLELADFFKDVELIKQKAVEQIAEVKVDEIFFGTGDSIDEALETTRDGLQKIDPTLVGALDNTKKRIASSLATLREKAAAAQTRRHEISLRQVEKAATHLYPSSNFQERALNILHFLNKYGLDFVRWLYGEISIDKFKHQIIRL